MIRTLRPHQARAIDLLRQSLGSGKKRPLLQAPTGFGKTLTAAAIIESALAKGKRIVFTVPALSLVDQAVQDFWAEGIRDVGVIQGQHMRTDWSRPVQVASVQTLMRRELPNADLVLIDEAHRWFNFYGKWMLEPAWRARPFIGLSATPWTRGLGRYFDDLIIAATTSDLIEQGYLAPFRVFAPSHPDLSDVRTVAGDFHEGDLSQAMNGGSLVADIVETWRRLGENRSTFCFAVDRAHAKTIQQRFIAAGVCAEYIDANTPMNEREEIKRRFHDGEVRVVANVGCLTTGIDWDVRCIILARPTKSEILFCQAIGRGLRTAEAKEDCLILDHSDTHLRLGFVTDIIHDKLDDGRERAKADDQRMVLPKECPKCSYLRPARTPKCPVCGFKAEVVSQVEVVAGKLAELNPQKKKKPEATHADKQRWYSQLLFIAKQRGYRSGWSANQYRQKFDVWPRGLAETLATPTPEVVSYVKASMIRYAKRKNGDGPVVSA